MNIGLKHYNIHNVDTIISYALPIRHRRKPIHYVNSVSLVKDPKKERIQLKVLAINRS